MKRPMFGASTLPEPFVRAPTAAVEQMGVDLAERSVENMSLREMLRDAERLCRDLADHLERGFAPKAQALAKVLRSETAGTWNEGVTDRTVHDGVVEILNSHAFTERVLQRIRELLKAIDASVAAITSGLRA